MALENRVVNIARPPRLPESEREFAERVEEGVKLISASTERDRVVLGILTYCYALGIYSSDEIENSIAGDANADSIYAIAFRNTTPAGALRAFRRANRQAVVECLALVLEGPDPLTDAAERVRLAIEADSFALDF